MDKSIDDVDETETSSSGIDKTKLKELWPKFQ